MMVGTHSDRPDSQGAPTRGEIAEAVRRVGFVSPGFNYEWLLQRGVTSLLLAGTRYGEPAVAKVLHNPAPHWRDQFAREIAAYRLFEQAAPPVPVPRLLDASVQQSVLVMTGIDGVAVDAARHPVVPPERAMLAAAFTQLRQLAMWRPITPDSWRVDYALRLTRTLRHAELDSRERAALARLTEEAIREADASGWSFAHGDLELSNVLKTSASLAFVDWGSAGGYLPGFDLALWWVLFGDLTGPRKVVDDVVEEGGVVQRRSFLVNLALLTARELRTHQNMRPSTQRDERVARLARDWDEVRMRIGAQS